MAPDDPAQQQKDPGPAPGPEQPTILIFTVQDEIMEVKDVIPAILNNLGTSSNEENEIPFHDIVNRATYGEIIMDENPQEDADSADSNDTMCEGQPTPSCPERTESEQATIMFSDEGAAISLAALLCIA